MYTILIVEDDPSFGYILKEYLELNQLQVKLITDGEQALRTLQRSPFDLCLLDIMLPKMDGYSLAGAIRSDFPDLPFLFLTAKALKVDKLKGFRLGCDDYIVKPIDEELLLARIHAIMNRTGHAAFAKKEPDAYQMGSLTFRVSDQVLQNCSDQQFLTDKEAQLLAMLCAHQNRLFPRRKALQQIWGTHDEFSRKSMDVFIFRLRKYLDAQSGIRIRNVHGKGFVLELDVDTPDRRG